MDGHNLSLKRLQGVELEILKECIRICEKNNILYFLLGGSALGAVRHRGFIPWDDDIDVGMPRPGYDQFISIAQKEFNSEKYFLQTCDTDPSYYLPFGKIRDSSTTLIEASASHISMNHGVYVDLFPLDGCPRNRTLLRYNMLLFKTYRAFITHKLGFQHKKPTIRFIVSVLSSFWPMATLKSRIEKAMKKMKYEESEFVVNWGGFWGLREAMPRDFFHKGIKVRFENIEVRIPSNFDGYLRSLYGNYMILPKIKERTPPHPAKVIDLENSFTKYVEHSL